MRIANHTSKREGSGGEWLATALIVTTITHSCEVALEPFEHSGDAQLGHMRSGTMYTPSVLFVTYKYLSQRTVVGTAGLSAGRDSIRRGRIVGYQGPQRVPLVDIWAGFRGRGLAWQHTSGWLTSRAESRRCRSIRMHPVGQRCSERIASRIQRLQRRATQRQSCLAQCLGLTRLLLWHPLQQDKVSRSPYSQVSEKPKN